MGVLTSFEHNREQVTTCRWKKEHMPYSDPLMFGFNSAFIDDCHDPWTKEEIADHYSRQERLERMVILKSRQAGISSLMRAFAEYKHPATCERCAELSGELEVMKDKLRAADAVTPRLTAKIDEIESGICAQTGVPKGKKLDRSVIDRRSRKKLSIDNGYNNDVLGSWEEQS
jgi:hypothetical protein